MLIVLLTNRKDYEPFLADVVSAFDGLGDLGYHVYHLMFLEYNNQKSKRGVFLW